MNGNRMAGWVVIIMTDDECAEGCDLESRVSPEGLMAYETTVAAREYYQSLDMVCRAANVFGR